ncbi:NADPH-dependent FMN reductase [Psychromonas ingrahamii 37]|uniref:NADPH-dependent FMN reductase n=1 Tax=Psychromonas ingrahamii (strain DSM 17664 / CCUG 51855 / 37) TaxID=357804 RepID=A1SWG6_PSYIN|nr:NAD(P)H-dependent oxidoreductase [Psychromonas ingrahamii]ABM03831.1 NADPH-dependent FMN reductase [Psychromonas ingrahamii 37]
MKKILAFSGSNNSQSINQNLINITASKVKHNDVTVIDLKDFPLPIYSIDIETQGIPEEAKRLKKIMFGHDALIIASPEHNGSMPAFLKNTIDWLSRLAKPGQSFFGETKKPVLLLSTSPGATGGATNIKTMAELMPWWGGDVKGTYSLGSYYEKFSDGKFDLNTDQELTDLVRLFESTFK